MQTVGICLEAPALIWKSIVYSKSLFCVFLCYYPSCSLFPRFSHRFSICRKNFYWEAVSTIVTVVSAEVVLAARIYAVYDFNKRLLVALITMGAVESVLCLTISLFSLPKMRPIPFPGQTGCYLVTVPSFTFLTWIPALIVEIILLSLMLYRAWGIYIERGKSSLIRLLVRDSILYFSTNVAILLLNTVIWANDQTVIESVTSWALAIPCTMISRLLLNMRSQYYESPETLSPSTAAGVEMSSIHIIQPQVSRTSVVQQPPGIKDPLRTPSFSSSI
ncbi:hypothetical protein K439DRAFT_194776 [Ramaria rubella]|nr:hypothetical protein K439DRAFT_194776 [Ramaria rubella]